MLTKEQAQKRVNAGVDLLNDLVPGWKKTVNKKKVDIAKFDACISGQLNAGVETDQGEEFNFFKDVLDCDAAKGAECGFDVAHDEVSPAAYKLLTEAWQAQL